MSLAGGRQYFQHFQLTSNSELNALQAALEILPVRQARPFMRGCLEASGTIPCQVYCPSSFHGLTCGLSASEMSEESLASSVLNQSSSAATSFTACLFHSLA